MNKFSNHTGNLTQKVPKNQRIGIIETILSGHYRLVFDRVHANSTYVGVALCVIHREKH